MDVVGVGLVKVHEALREDFAGVGHSVPLLMAMSAAFCPFLYFTITLLHKSSSDPAWALVPVQTFFGEIVSLPSFTVSCQL